MTLREQDAGPDRGCACPSPDAHECARIRYGDDAIDEPCECACHEWYDPDEHPEGELK